MRRVKGFWIGVLGIASVSSLTGDALAQSKGFTDKQLADAKTYIDTKMDPALRDQLRAMAQKSGQKPEHMFLTIQAMSRADRTLGGGSGDLNIPSKGQGKDSPKGKAGSGDPDIPPKDPKKKP